MNVSHFRDRTIKAKKNDSPTLLGPWLNGDWGPQMGLSPRLFFTKEYCSYEAGAHNGPGNLHFPGGADGAR